MSPSSLPIAAPTTTDELASIVTAAARNKEAIAISGSGSKLDWGGVVTGAKSIVSTQKLDRLIAHAVGDLTVTVETGMPLVKLQEILAAAGQFLPLDPAYPDRATIGGIISTADTGSLRHRYGGVRDLLLGIQFVRADGQIAKAGGRVVKNVAGYDLMKLFTGAYGTLGVLTEVTLRVYPLPKASATVILTGDINALGEVARTLLGSSLTPTAVDLVSTAMSLELEIDRHPSLIARFQTLPESIDEQTEQLLTWGKQLGIKGGIWREDREAKLWQNLQLGIWDKSPIGCKFGVRSTAVAQMISEVDRLTEKNERAIVHIGSGIGAVGLTDANLIAILRQQCMNNGGFLSILSAPIAIKQAQPIWGFRDDSIKVMQQIKQKFDPDNRLNPGKFF